MPYCSLISLCFVLVWHTLMFQQAVFRPNVDRRKSKREEDGWSKGYRRPCSELARCGAEGENDAAALLLPLLLLRLLSAMCSRFCSTKSPKGTWSRPKQQAGSYEPKRRTWNMPTNHKTPILPRQSSLTQIDDVALHELRSGAAY